MDPYRSSPYGNNPSTISQWSVVDKLCLGYRPPPGAPPYGGYRPPPGMPGNYMPPNARPPPPGVAMPGMGQAPVGRPPATAAATTTAGGDAENLTTLFVGAIPAGVNDGWIEKLLTVRIPISTTSNIQSS